MKKMRKENRDHLERLLNQFNYEVKQKYKSGYRKHGGGLLKMTAIELVREAKQETIDQYVYLQRLEEMLKK